MHTLSNKLILLIIIHLLCASCKKTDIKNYKEAPIITKNDIALEGRYYAAKKKGPGVLLLCQCDPTTDQNEYNSLAKKLQSNGYHVLSFDYPGFGNSEGDKPNLMAMNSMDEVMNYWRENWIEFVDKAFNLLKDKNLVDENSMFIVGASCGNFLALEYALSNNNVKALGLLGGPVDNSILERLEKNNIPMFIVAGNEGPTFEWIDATFNVSKHEESRIMKFNYVLHGTEVFKKAPFTEDLIINWFNNFKRLKQ